MLKINTIIYSTKQKRLFNPVAFLLIVLYKYFAQTNLLGDKRMKIKGLVDEDFLQYKKPSMFVNIIMDLLVQVLARNVASLLQINFPEWLGSILLCQATRKFVKENLTKENGTML